MISSQTSGCSKICNETKDTEIPSNTFFVPQLLLFVGVLGGGKGEVAVISGSLVAITHHSIKLHEAALAFSAGLDGNYPRSSPKFYPIAVQLVWEWTYDQGMNWWRCDLKVNIHH